MLVNQLNILYWFTDIFQLVLQSQQRGTYFKMFLPSNPSLQGMEKLEQHHVSVQLHSPLIRYW